MKTTALLAAGAAAVVSGISFVPPADAADTIRYGSRTPVKSSLVRKGVQPWMRQVEKDSGGELTFKEFHGGSLVRSLRKQYEAVENGIQDAATFLPSYTAKLFPDFTIFALPYMFTDPNEASVAAWRFFEAGHLGGLGKVKVAAVYTNDNGGLHFKPRFTSLDDIKGKKIRAAGPAEAAVIRIMGGAPVSMGIPAVAESINRGVIAGLLAGWSALRTFRLEPLLQTHVAVPFGVRSFVLGIGKTKYDGLSAASRRAIDKNSGLSLSKSIGALNQANWVRVVNAAKKDGKSIIAPTGDLEKSLRKKFQGLHDEWIAKTPNGQVKYDAMVKILADIRKGS